MTARLAAISAALPRLWKEKVPPFAMSAVSCMATLVAQRAGGAIQTLESFTFPERATPRGDRAVPGGVAPGARCAAEGSDGGGPCEPTSVLTLRPRGTDRWARRERLEPYSTVKAASTRVGSFEL